MWDFPATHLESLPVHLTYLHMLCGAHTELRALPMPCHRGVVTAYSGHPEYHVIRVFFLLTSQLLANQAPYFSLLILFLRKSLPITEAAVPLPLLIYLRK